MFNPCLPHQLHSRPNYLTFSYVPVSFPVLLMSYPFLHSFIHTAILCNRTSPPCSGEEIGSLWASLNASENMEWIQYFKTFAFFNITQHLHVLQLIFISKQPSHYWCFPTKSRRFSNLKNYKITLFHFINLLKSYWIFLYKPVFNCYHVNIIL